MKSSVKLAAASIAVALCSGAWAAPGTQGETRSKPAAQAPAKAVKKPGAEARAKKKAPSTTARVKKPAATAKAPASRSKPTVAARAPAAVPPREPYWTPLPPSRFYPNGIPELRPEFLHPLPSERPVVAAPPPARTYEVPGHIEMMP